MRDRRYWGNVGKTGRLEEQEHQKVALGDTAIGAEKSRKDGPREKTRETDRCVVERKNGVHPSNLISTGPWGARYITESCRKGGRAREGEREGNKVCLSAHLLWLVLGSRLHALYII